MNIFLKFKKFKNLKIWNLKCFEKDLEFENLKNLKFL